MNYYVLVVNRTENVHGGWISARELATRRLAQKSWGLYERTTHRKRIAPQDKLLVYLAGAHQMVFFATATVESITHEGGGIVDGMDALTETPASTLKLTDIRLFKVLPKISDLKDRLQFIPKGTSKWGVALQGGLKRISKADYDLILLAGEITGPNAPR